jgi:hypothetical protein
MFSDERMGLSHMNTLCLCQVYISHVYHVIENSSLCTIYKSSVSPGFAEQIMSILLILCYNGSLVTWTVISFTAAKFKLLIFFVPGFAVSYAANMFILMILFLLVACTILLYNHIHMEGWKPCRNCGPVCTLENFQWHGEPCFAGAANLRCRCLLLIPRQGKRKSLLI